MSAANHEAWDRARVRTRMADWARDEARSLSSELENYGRHFTLAERANMRSIIMACVSLAELPTEKPKD